MEKISQERAEQLFNEFADYIFKTAYMLTQSQVLADDVTQESFIRIFRHYYTFDETKPIKPWIYKIVLNTFRELKRKQKWLIFSDSLPDQEKANIKIEEELIKKEAEKELLAFIGKLPDKNKEVVILYYFEDFSLKEISEILSIPLGTCKSRLHYAIKKLNKLCRQNLFWVGGQSYEP